MVVKASIIHVEMSVTGPGKYELEQPEETELNIQKAPVRVFTFTSSVVWQQMRGKICGADVSQEGVNNDLPSQRHRYL